MGLEVKSNKTYVNILGGSLVIEVAEGTEKAIKRTKTTGRVVWEMHYPTLTGIIIDKEIKNSDVVGKQLQLTIRDDKDYVLNVGVNSNFFSRFAKSLKNIDFSKPLSISVKKDGVTKTGKDKTATFFNQGDSPIKQFYSKDNPGDLPQATMKKEMGEEKWDYSAQANFLYDLVDKWELSPVATGDIKGADLTSDEEDNDLPF